MKRRTTFSGVIGGVIGAIISVAAVATLTFVLAAPTAPPPTGNPPYPAQGPPGPQGATGITGYRIVSTGSIPGNTFAAGVNISCAANEYAVGCSSSCTAGDADTVAYPINNTTCRGEEPSDNAHAGTCILYAHCLTHS